MDNVTIGGRYYDEVHGSSIPGPIWRDAMDGALGDNAKSFDLKRSTTSSKLAAAATTVATAEATATAAVTTATTVAELSRPRGPRPYPPRPDGN